MLLWTNLTKYYQFWQNEAVFDLVAGRGVETSMQILTSRRNLSLCRKTPKAKVTMSIVLGASRLGATNVDYDTGW